MPRLAFLTVAAASLLAATASAEPAEQDAVLEGTRKGTILPLPDIMEIVRPQVRGELLGSDFDAARSTYRLKYLERGSVVWVDVDARSGRIIRERRP